MIQNNAYFNLISKEAYSMQKSKSEPPQGSSIEVSK